MTQQQGVSQVPHLWVLGCSGNGGYHQKEFLKFLYRSVHVGLLGGKQVEMS